MFDPQGRPGDNLYTNSIIALDVDTGELKWHFQTVPNESWDYDAVAITQLIDTPINGEMRKVISQTNRNGFYYALDRANGQFLLGKPFTNVNWTLGLDPKTGKPLDYDPAKAVQDYAGRAVRYGKKAIDGQPAHYGMPTLMPNTYDPATGLTYFNAMIGQANYFNSRPADPTKQQIGAGFREIFCGANTRENAVEPIVRNVTNPNCKVSHGLLGGIDTRTGTVAKKRSITRLFKACSAPRRASVHGRHRARSPHDKDTMKELWSFDTGTTAARSPMTYSVMANGIALTLGGRLGATKGVPRAAALGRNDPDGVRPLGVPVAWESLTNPLVPAQAGVQGPRNVSPCAWPGVLASAGMSELGCNPSRPGLFRPSTPCS
jgi:alcohol dehydrogenase (cytochrome c)